MAHITNEDMHNALEAYLNFKDTSQRLPLYKLLNARPSTEDPGSLLPLEEFETRLIIIHQLRKMREDLLPEPDASFHFTNSQLACLFLMPINVLQRIQQDIMSLSVYFNAYAYARFFVHGRSSGDSQSRTQSRTQSVSQAPSIHRNAAQRNMCLLRDQQACILTKAAYPEVCHIVPYAITSSQANINQLAASSMYTRALIGDQEANQLELIATSSLGSLDKSWNMLCLHPTLHSWWSRCLFGIKCLGIVPKDETTSTVQIQFHWMPRNNLTPNSFVKPPYNNTFYQMLTTIEPTGGIGIVADVNRDSFHPLETGQTFDILVEKGDAMKMKLVLDLQWAVVRLSALSGAAGELDWDFDAEGDGGNAASAEYVEDWLENVSEPASP